MVTMQKVWKTVIKDYFTCSYNDLTTKTTKKLKLPCKNHGEFIVNDNFYLLLFYMH